jgi:hypothetical protein
LLLLFVLEEIGLRRRREQQNNNTSRGRENPSSVRNGSRDSRHNPKTHASRRSFTCIQTPSRREIIALRQNKVFSCPVADDDDEDDDEATITTCAGRRFRPRLRRSGSAQVLVVAEKKVHENGAT